MALLFAIDSIQHFVDKSIPTFKPNFFVNVKTFFSQVTLKSPICSNAKTEKQLVVHPKKL